MKATVCLCPYLGCPHGFFCLPWHRPPPANNDLWFHMFCKWIHEFSWLNSRVSVCEFTGFCETNLVCRHLFTVKSRVFHVMTRTSETVPVLTQYDSCQTRSKLMTTDRSRVFMWIHIKTCTGGALPIMNKYDTCQLDQKWFLVCWDKQKQPNPVCLPRHTSNVGEWS